MADKVKGFTLTQKATGLDRMVRESTLQAQERTGLRGFRTYEACGGARALARGAHLWASLPAEAWPSALCGFQVFPDDRFQILLCLLGDVLLARNEGVL